MKRRLLISILLLSSLALPTGAMANPYTPTLLEMIAGPNSERTWFFDPVILPVTLIFLLPPIVVIALVELLAIRRRLPGFSGWNVFIKLFALNLITSVIGFISVPPTDYAWLALVIAFVEAVVFEMYLMYVPGLFGKKPLNKYAALSIRMNSMSYIVLAIVLAIMLYGPLIGTENKAMLSDIRGRIIIYDKDRCLSEVSLNKKPYRMVTKSMPDYLRREVWVLAGGSIACRNSGQSSVLFYNKLGGKSRLIKAPCQHPQIAGVSPDGSLLCCTSQSYGEAVIYSVKEKKIVYTFPKDEGVVHVYFSRDNRFVGPGRDESHLIDLRYGKRIESANLPYLRYDIIFSPANDKLTKSSNWRDGDTIVYDCVKDKVEYLHVPGWFYCPVWSPDGKYLAYLTPGVNPYLKHKAKLDLRVICADGKGSVTIIHNVPVGQLIWAQ